MRSGSRSDVAEGLKRHRGGDRRHQWTPPRGSTFSRYGRCSRSAPPTASSCFGAADGFSRFARVWWSAGPPCSRSFLPCSGRREPAHSTPARRRTPNDLAQARSRRYPTAVVGNSRWDSSAPSTRQCPVRGKDLIGTSAWRLSASATASWPPPRRPSRRSRCADRRSKALAWTRRASSGTPPSGSSIGWWPSMALI
jgi:hypothetical protein